MRLKTPSLALFAAAALAASACAGDPSAPTPAPIGTTAAGATLAVPGVFGTIDAALSVAAAGDEVVVAPGVYYEGLLGIPTGVTLRGAGAAEDTIIYSQAFTFDGVGVVVRDLTFDGAFEGALGTAVGLQLVDSAATVERVVFRGFDIGLQVERELGGTAGPVLVDAATFDGNTVGLETRNMTGLTVVNSVFTFNGGRGLYGYFGELAPSDLVFANNLFLANGYGAGGVGAIDMEETEGFVLLNNVVVSNKVGLACASACPSSHSLIWGNGTDYAGAASPGLGDLNVDPQLANPTEGDFAPLADSPLIDAGAETNAPATDRVGRDRPLGEGFDIGPFEYPSEPVGSGDGGVIVISEVLANPIDEDLGEFVELLNVGTASVDLDGWVIDDGDSTDVLTGFDGGPTVLEAGAYALIVDPEYPTSLYDLPAGTLLLTPATTTTIGSGLANNDPIKLFPADSQAAADTYSYPFNPGNGVSVEKDVLEDGDTEFNWVGSPCGMSPGAVNCASLPTNVSKEVLIAINEVMANPLDETTGEFVELLNFGADPVDVGGWILSDGDATDTIAGYAGGATTIQPGQYAVILDPDYTGEYFIPSDALLLGVASTTTLGSGLSNSDPVSLLDDTGFVVVDSYAHPFNAGNGVSVAKVAFNIGDIASNWVASSCASGSSPGAPNCAAGSGVDPIGEATIALTEVMSNAIDEDTGEFLELYNYGTEPVDLAGFRVSDGDAEEPIEAFEAGGSTVLEAGGFALVLDAEYAGEYAIPPGVLLLRTPDTSIGTGLSTNDPITVRGPKAAKVLDSLSAPFNPGNGVSAEKLDLIVGDVPQNWLGSVCAAGSSPGTFGCDAGDPPPAPDAPVGATALVISEVMANPLVESTGEYIELFNAGSVGIDVAGFVIGDDDAQDVIEAWGSGGTLIQPGQFAVVLDPDYDSVYSIPTAALKLTVGNSTLGNGLTTTDPVTLWGPDGTTALATYGAPFNAGNGVAIEKLSLTAPDGPDAWAGSTCSTAGGDANDGASPGAPNCVAPATSSGGTNVLGQPCPFGGADCVSGLCATEVLTGQTFCTLDCSTNADACPTGFTCDIIGDALANAVCIPVSGGALPDAVLNEIVYDSVGTDTDVFVEIKASPDAIMDGLQLVGVNGSNGNEYNAINLTGLVGPDGYFVVAHPNASAEILAQADMVTKKVDFQNGPDSIVLRAGDTALDAVAYGSFDVDEISAGEGAPAVDVSGTGSLGRLPDGGDTGSNSVDFVELVTPTPGAPNDGSGGGPVGPPAPVIPAGLVLTELVATPTDGEFVEVTNAGDTVADLSHVWIGDHSGYHLVAGEGMAPASSDFRVRFPAGATLGAGETVVVALDPAADFESVYGFAPDFDLSEGDAGAPAMLGTYGGSAGLTNGGEPVMLFWWDGEAPLVTDLDYVVFGTSADVVDKTGVAGYAADTPGGEQASLPAHSDGESLSRCGLEEGAELQSGGNGVGGADETSEDLEASWFVASTPTPGAPSECEASSAAPVAFTTLPSFGPSEEYATFPGAWIVTSAAAFEASTGQTAPAELVAGTKHVLWASAGLRTLPVHDLAVAELTVDGGTLTVAATLQTPGPGCESLEYEGPIATAVLIDPLPTAPTSVDFQLAEAPFDCTAGGSDVGWGCSPSEPCAAGGICSGVATWGDSGNCNEAWMHDVFDGETDVAIADASTTYLPVAVSGLASVEVDVIVKVTFTHTSPGDLEIWLQRPYTELGEVNQEGLVFQQVDAGSGTIGVHTVMYAFSGDDSVNGIWRLKVVDNEAGGSGTIDSWSLELTSRYD